MKKAEIPASLYYQIFSIEPGRGEQRKIQILEAFIECVATQGLENTSFDSLGKKVGMNRTHVAYYFANREELIRTAVRFVVATGQQGTIAAVDRASGSKAKLQAIIEGPFDWLKQHPKHAAILAMFYSQATYDKALRELNTTIRTMGEQRLYSCLHPYVEAGKLSENDARDLARSIQFIIIGALHALYSTEYPVPNPKAKALAVKSCLQLVNTTLKK